MPNPTQRAAWVVVPAKDERDHVGAAIDALNTAAARAGGSVHLVIVDDGSTDGSDAIIAGRFDGWLWGDATVLPGPAAGVGWARRVGLDHALAAAGARHDDDALIATTDADSRVPPHWFDALHGLLDDGHRVIAGDVHLERGAATELVSARAERLAKRLHLVHRRDPSADHPHFAGANLAWDAATLRRLTPLPTPAALEDDALHDACVAAGLAITRDASFPVSTSARTAGRAGLGLAAALHADAVRLGLQVSPA